VLLGFFPGWHRLQREELLARARPHCDPVGDQAADQIIQRTAIPLRRQPGVLHVAFDEATLLQHLADACANLLHQLL